MKGLSTKFSQLMSADRHLSRVSCEMTKVTVFFYFSRVLWHRTNFRTAGSVEKYLGSFLPAVRFEPKTAGYKARTLLLCYAVPPKVTVVTQLLSYPSVSMQLQVILKPNSNSLVFKIQAHAQHMSVCQQLQPSNKWSTQLGFCKCEHTLVNGSTYPR